MFKKLHPSLSLLASDAGSFQQQENIFVVFNLSLLLVLVFLHHLFSSFRGWPSRFLLLAVSLYFALAIAELIWIRKLSQPVNAALFAWSSIVINVAVAILLSTKTVPILSSWSYRSSKLRFTLNYWPC